MTASRGCARMPAGKGFRTVATPEGVPVPFSTGSGTMWSLPDRQSIGCACSSTPIRINSRTPPFPPTRPRPMNPTLEGPAGGDITHPTGTTLGLVQSDVLGGGRRQTKRTQTKLGPTSSLCDITGDKLSVQHGNRGRPVTMYRILCGLWTGCVREANRRVLFSCPAPSNIHHANQPVNVPRKTSVQPTAAIYQALPIPPASTAVQDKSNWRYT